LEWVKTKKLTELRKKYGDDFTEGTVDLAITDVTTGGI